VLPRTDSVEAVLAEQRRQRDGTTDQERIKRLGAGRNAQFVLSGSVQKLGTLNMFTADILNILDGGFIDGHEEQYTDFSQGFDLIPKLAALVNGFSVTVNSAETFMRAISDINAAGPGMYTITLTGNITINTVISLIGSTYTQKSVVIQGDSAMRSITRNFDSNLFYIPANCTLILGNNVTLNGNSKNFLVVYVDGGRFEMRDGSVITGSNGSGVALRTNAVFTLMGGSIRNNKGGGVDVGNGTFTMNGGTISGNTAGDHSRGGGGVYVYGGTFIMSSGTISGNIASISNGGGVFIDSGTFIMSGGSISKNIASGDSSYGGGVYVYSDGTFTMSGGTISGNTASYGGGGVCAGAYRGTFTMSGGTISGNTTSGYGGGVFVVGTFTMNGGTISGNTASDYGGGVYVYSGTFTKTSGTITGYANDTANGNQVRNNSGTVLSNRGHAVNMGGVRFRESTAGPNVNLDSTKTGAAGGWEEESWSR